MSRRGILLALLLAPATALAACGRKGDLEPPPKEKDDERRREGGKRS